MIDENKYKKRLDIQNKCDYSMSMKNPTQNMKLIRDSIYKRQFICHWRGKYSKKNERLFSIGNKYFETFVLAKEFIDDSIDSARREI